MPSSGSYTQPAGNTTSTSTSAPWEPQQPYLQQGFQSAQGLYNSGGPQYYPGATYAPSTGGQDAGINQLWTQGNNLFQNAGVPTSTLNNFLQGGYLNSNPALSNLSALAEINPGTSNFGLQSLENLANGQSPAGFNTSSPYASLLGLGQTNPAYLNPAYGNLASTAAGNVGTGGALGALGGVADGGLGLAPSRGVLQGNAQNGTNLSLPSSALADVANGGLGLAPSKGTFQNLAANGAGVQAPQSALSSIFSADPAQLAGASGTDYLNRLLTPGAGNFVNNAGNVGGQALGGFASGSHTNPYLDQLTEATRAAVLPGIQSQFINGGGLSSPGAAYASSQGVGAALAPVLNQAYQQEEQNQLNAAGQYAGLYNQGIGLKTNAAQTLAGIEQGNIGQQINAAGQFGNLALGNAGVQNTAAQNLANTQLSKYGLQANSANMLGNLGLQNTAQQNSAASALGNLQLGKAGAITNAATNQGNLALGGTNAATTAGTNLGNQTILGGSQQATDLSQALSSALGFGTLQGNAANNIGNQAVAGQNAQTTAATGLGNTYNQGISGMLQALGMYPATAQATTLGPQAEYQAGQWQQQNQQAAINDEIQRYNFSQTQPYNNLNQFLGQISGNYGGAGSVSQPYYLNQGANTASNVLGTGLGLATGVGAVNSAFPAFLPWLATIL